MKKERTWTFGGRLMYQKGRNGFISREREQICMYKKGNLAGDMVKLVNISLLQRYGKKRDSSFIFFASIQ